MHYGATATMQGDLASFQVQLEALHEESEAAERGRQEHKRPPPRSAVASLDHRATCGLG